MISFLKVLSAFSIFVFVVLPLAPFAAPFSFSRWQTGSNQWGWSGRGTFWCRKKISETKKVWKETEDRNRSVITRELTPPDLFSLNPPLLFAIPPRITLAGAVWSLLWVWRCGATCLNTKTQCLPLQCPQKSSTVLSVVQFIQHIWKMPDLKSQRVLFCNLVWKKYHKYNAKNK